MKKKLKNILLTILFLLIVLLVTIRLTRIYSISNIYSEHAEMMIKGFYDLEDDSVDAVLVGSSRVYRFYQPAFAWENYGIATTNFSTSNLPYGAMKNAAIEVLKTQKPKVLVLEAAAFAQAESVKKGDSENENNGDNEDLEDANNKIYLLLNNMKFSLNYVDTLKNFIDYHKIPSNEVMNYVFPLMQFHSRWAETNEGDFVQEQECYLNSCYQKEFLKEVAVKSLRVDTQLRTPIKADCERALRDLLQWCKEQEAEILFLASPTIKKEEYLGRLNYIGDIVSEYDIPYLNYNQQELFDSIGFDVPADFQNFGHTNIKGSYKFTNVFGAYLMEHYGLQSRRGEAAYADWDQKAEQYHKKVDKYLYKGQK